MVIVLMNFPLWHLYFMNLNVELEWWQGFIILQLKSLDVTVSSMLIASSIALLAWLLPSKIEMQYQSLSTVFLILLLLIVLFP